MSTLTFLVSTNARNIPFAIPYAYFAYKYNRNSQFELYVTDNSVDRSFLCSLDILKQKFPEISIYVQNCPITVFPDKYRFLVEPKHKSTFTYIGDIDIMICEDICKFHTSRMNNTYAYDNEIRPNRNALTGLHFVNTEKWYFATKKSREHHMQMKNINILNDETMLMNIAKDSKIKLRPKANSITNNTRPIHGQHISLSRQPFRSMSSMEVCLDKTYAKQFIETIHEKQFQDICNANPKFNEILRTYCNYCKVS